LVDQERCMLSRAVWRPLSMSLDGAELLPCLWFTVGPEQPKTLAPDFGELHCFRGTGGGRFAGQERELWLREDFDARAFPKGGGAEWADSRAGTNEFPPRNADFFRKRLLTGV